MAPTKSSFIRATLFSVASLILAVPPARAQTTTYTYVGKNFDIFDNVAPGTGPTYTYTPDNFLTFSMTLDHPMTAGAFTDLAGTLLSWSASDGKYNYFATGTVDMIGPAGDTPGESDALLFASFGLDPSGIPTTWYINFFGGSHSSEGYITNPVTVTGSLSVNFTFVEEGVYSRPNDSGAGDFEKAGVVRALGTWTVTTDGTTATPEPVSVALLASGMVALGGFAARRKRNIVSRSPLQ